MIVVTGGKGGVGATTVAVNLAAALARSGRARRAGRCGAARGTTGASWLGVDADDGNDCSTTCCRASATAADALCTGPGGNLAAGRARGRPNESPDRSRQCASSDCSTELQSLDDACRRAGRSMPAAALDAVDAAVLAARPAGAAGDHAGRCAR